MAFDKDCPCTKDCEQRPNCKGCEKVKAYKEKKFAEYENNACQIEFGLYNSFQINRAAKKSERFRKGSLK